MSIQVWEPNPLEKLTWGRNNYELEEAKRRVYIGKWGEYKYTPSQAYMKFISKFTRGPLHGKIFGKTF